MRTPYIVGLTIFATVATFSAGGYVATTIMKATMPDAAQPAANLQAAPQLTAEQMAKIVADAMAARDSLVAAKAPVVDSTAPASIAMVEPAKVEEVVATAPAAEAASNTADVLKSLMASQAGAAPAAKSEVVLLDMVSASESRSQLESAVSDRLSQAVITAIGNGKSRDDLELMVENAIELGLVDAPKALRSADGKPDARAILLHIIKEEETKTGQKIVLAGAESEAATQPPVRNEIYVVEPGDSLAYIALKYYGDSESYRIIYNANRSKIDSPDRIRPGQRLIIPAI